MRDVLGALRVLQGNTLKFCVMPLLMRNVKAVGHCVQRTSMNCLDAPLLQTEFALPVC